MTTNEIGTVTQAKVMARLLERGERVLVPYGNIGRYDLALDRAGTLVRVECKTGRLRGGVVRFKTEGNRSSYDQDADLFGVWCPENDKVYLIPVSDAAIGSMMLRVDPPKVNQSNIRWASAFEI